jgi:hypothetical protein
MKRRQVIQALLVTPAITAVPGAAQAQRPAADPVLATVTPDSVGDAVVRYFSAPQAAALRRLGDLMVPGTASRPGAREAGAAEFLDFLISQSPADRQTLYRDGLDRLQAESRRRFSKGFEELSAEQADGIFAPLHAAWTYSAPADPFARFLRQAKEDLLTATFNSREFAEAQTAAGRRGSGMGTYWLPIE